MNIGHEPLNRLLVSEILSIKVADKQTHTCRDTHTHIQTIRVA